MFEYFEAICRALLQPRSVAGILPILDPTEQLNTEADDTAAPATLFQKQRIYRFGPRSAVFIRQAKPS
jgi:hypothetical protein